MRPEQQDGPQGTRAGVTGLHEPPSEARLQQHAVRTRSRRNPPIAGRREERDEGHPGGTLPTRRTRRLSRARL
eukprot:6170250-Heterocapsa_arctica.AAC.1